MAITDFHELSPLTYKYGKSRENEVVINTHASWNE